MTLKSMSSWTLDEWFDYIVEQHPIEHIELGLERIKQVAIRSNLLSFGDAKIVTVGGTNGKGSTCKIMEQILIEAGYRVGAYSSPHFHDFRERVRIQNEMLSSSEWVKAFQIVEASRQNIELTFFEMTTLVALYLFQQQTLDVILLEVGLGGRLDATNIVDSDVSVITSIDFDHQEYLGNTRSAIAFEKAGIMRQGKPVICGDKSPPVTLEEQAELLQAKLSFLGRDFSYQNNTTIWDFKGHQLDLTMLPYPQLHIENAVIALAALEALKLPLKEKDIRLGLQKAHLSGRSEVLQEAPRVLVDVAHNSQAARYLCEQIEKNKMSGRVFALVGMLKDKDIKQVLNVVRPCIDQWYVVTLASARSAKVQELQSMLSGQIVTGFESVLLAWQHIKPLLKANDLLVVFGSFYTVAQFKTTFFAEEISYVE